ncbi:MAG TPA: response regulator transcription factor [Chloroflexi bacterium]|nr:response regulator transcription factor [Chloroflexota bacterium]
MIEQRTVLLADDDEMIVDVLRHQLEREGFRVITTDNGAEALQLARSRQPDIVLLDVMMPGMQGWEVCRELRHESNVPILMLTARGEEMDRVLGLELGADDYIVKPFGFRELLARMRANLRRMALLTQTESDVQDALEQIGDITIDRRRHQVLRAGVPVNLTQREYDLLLALRDANGAVVRRGDLLDQVWGEGWIGDPRTLDVHIRWLREKLEADPSAPQLILTVRGVGYRLVTPAEVS